MHDGVKSPPPRHPPLLSWNPIGKGVISLGYPLREEDFEVLILKQYIIV